MKHSYTDMDAIEGKKPMRKQSRHMYPFTQNSETTKRTCGVRSLSTCGR
jgi:hypothetical protein